ncbi:glycosyltransferase family 2 protein [Empedobacter brevis]|uniref:glycosyltransferase family 2 protein n=1 Tax=Empedobacter brevis TaxID=247 RepID=UPI0039B0D54F
MNDIIVSVIIVNYNGKKYIKNCFDSLQEQLSNLSYEIILVDNNSSDDSVDYIKDNYPEVKVIESDENLGFGSGNNLGVTYAQGKYVLLFNNDTILLNPINEGISFLENNIDVGILGIKMIDAKKNYLQSAGIFPNYINMIIFKKLFINTEEFTSGNFKQNVYNVDWVSGAFMLLKKQLYEEINGFDKDYFMYVEDVDFCKKIADKNLKRVFFPSLKYIHYVGFKTTKNPLIIEGYKTYINKHYKNNIKKFILNICLSLSSMIKKIKYD